MNLYCKSSAVWKEGHAVISYINIIYEVAYILVLLPCYQQRAYSKLELRMNFVSTSETCVNKKKVWGFFRNLRYKFIVLVVKYNLDDEFTHQAYP